MQQNYSSKIITKKSPDLQKLKEPSSRRPAKEKTADNNLYPKKE